MRSKITHRFAPILFLLAAPLAQAHPGHGPADLASGFVHPFTGWDHLLAMIGVGIWATQLGGRSLWALPCAFVASMAAGAALGVAGFAPAGVEWWILSSVFILGLLVAFATRVPVAAGMAVAAAAGFAHGVAHGMEMPFQADSVRFLTGMVVATALLHSLGVAAGVVGGRRSPAVARVLGAGIAAGGVALLFVG
jgi:urease accessory protein